MNQLINIYGSDLAVHEIEGQRVVNYRQIAGVHNCNVNNLQQNFKRNRKHFKENKDYFKVSNDAETDNLSVSRMYFTESGYLLLTKSLKDDRSWDVMRELIDRYFKKPTTDFKVIEELMETKIALLKMKAKYYQLDGYTTLIERQSDKSNVESKTLYHVSEVAKMFYDEFKLGRNQLFDKLRELKLFYRRGSSNYPYQRYIDADYFRLHFTEVKPGIQKPVIDVTEKGKDYIYNRLQEELNSEVA